MLKVLVYCQRSLTNQLPNCNTATRLTVAISPINSALCCSKYVFSLVPVTDVDRWEAMFRVVAMMEGRSQPVTLRLDSPVDRRRPAELLEYANPNPQMLLWQRPLV